MPTSATLYATAVLLSLVGLLCTALCISWSIPALRQRLGMTTYRLFPQKPESDGLRGSLAHIGTGLISIALATTAIVTWYGVYISLTAL